MKNQNHTIFFFKATLCPIVELLRGGPEKIKTCVACKKEKKLGINLHVTHVHQVNLSFIVNGCQGNVPFIGQFMPTKVYKDD